MEESIYIIKPEAYPQREKIRQQIIDSKLKIVSKFEGLKISPDILNEFYSSVEAQLRNAMIRYLEEGFVEIGCVRGENAIQKMIEITGFHFNPAECAPNTIRAVYGSKEPFNYGGQIIFKNAIHRTHPRDADTESIVYWNKIVVPRIISEIQILLRKNCDSVDRIDMHIMPSYNFALLLSREYNISPEDVGIAALLHDYTRMQGDIKNHHITSADFAEALLQKYSFPERRISIIRGCILNHRGSIPNKNNLTLEEQIVISADAMTIILYPLPLFYSAFGKRKLSLQEGKAYIKNKLQRSFNKIKLEKALEVVKPKYDALMNMLNQ